MGDHNSPIYVAESTAHIPNRLLLRRWLHLFLGLWPTITAVYILVLRNLIIAFKSSPKDDPSHWFIPDGFVAAATLYFPVAGLALLLTIYLLTPLSNRLLFRPTRARLLGANGLWLVFPITTFFIAIPVSAGYMFLPLIEGKIGVFSLDAILRVYLPIPVSYIISCLLSSGIPKWWLRGLAYGLIWMALFLVMAAAGSIRLIYGNM